MMVVAVLSYNLLSSTNIIQDFNAWLSLFPQHILALVSIFLFMLFSVWGEEIGWRGFALPRLQEKYHPLLASLILGAIWATWHLPTFWMEGSVHSRMGFAYFFSATLGYSILYSWVFNGAKGSLFLICLLHAANNATVTYTMLFFEPLIGKPVFSLTILGLFDVIVIALSKANLLYRKKTEGM